MDDKILSTVKKYVGITDEYQVFDQTLIDCINTVFAKLNQLGVGPKNVFIVDGNEQTWKEFTEDERLNMIKIYISMSVKMMFDPPTNSILLDALKNTISELEWRMHFLSEGEEH